MKSIEGIPEAIAPQIAENEEDVGVLKQKGADPIIHRLNAQEVVVYTKNPKVLEHIREGNNWNSGETDEDTYGYVSYTYTRLSEEELADHLKDPTIHQGSD